MIYIIIIKLIKLVILIKVRIFNFELEELLVNIHL